ncbi:hypothetical protein ACMFMF_004189 [Clarireedia jacksonii]
MSPALNYGQQAYEGMKAFRAPGDKEITLFRPNKNAVRLAHSAEFVSIPPVPEKVFIECVHAAVSLNAAYVPPHETGAALYIRPLVFGSSPQLPLSPPEEYTFCVYVLPVGVYHGVHPVKALILEEFDRSAPHGTGSAKVGGNYAPVLRWSDKARNEGYGITLHLDSQTRSEIDEFSTSGFIGVKKDGDNVTLVVPDSKNVIASVTSDSVLEIGKSFGWKTEVRSVRLKHQGILFRLILISNFADQIRRAPLVQRSHGSWNCCSSCPHPIYNPKFPFRSLFIHLRGLRGARPNLQRTIEHTQGHSRGKDQGYFWLEQEGRTA